MHREKGQEPLRKAVKRLDEGLWHQLEELWRLAEEGIQDAQRSKDGHQQGTPHCRAVEQNLGALIPDDWKGTRFSATDLFILSAASALHDASKASDAPGDHGHVSMWEVRRRAEIFGLDQGQAEVVGWVVRAHNDGDLEALPAEPVPLRGIAEVDIRPLAALFKLADALHTDYRRVSRQVAEAGGRGAEDNPKTRFRLRVRGWRFDDQGRIELYAVPKDWEDVSVISTGFDMTRRELEPVAPTLQDAGLPWELTLRVDDTDLEQRAVVELEAEERVEWAFVGMGHFTEADASRFKGRDDDALKLQRHVMAKPVTLLVGDSGVGKTSLIYAGLFPLLHRAWWRTTYTRPFDDPQRFVVRYLWEDLRELAGEPPTDVTIVEALGRASRAVGPCKLLVVLDQFEDVVRAASPEALDGLRQVMVAVLAGRFRNLRLLVSYRADAEAVLGPFFQEVAGSDRGLPRVYLEPLSRDGAWAALDVGFAETQVGVSDPLLLDTITDDLELQTPNPGVYPPYVQMVGETLRRAAREEGASILTEELYRKRGGCEGIIGRYLLERLADFGEQETTARRALGALVRSTGVKGQRDLTELQAETELDLEQLRQVLAELVNRRMVRHLGGARYEIIHDYLAYLVDREIVNPPDRQLKELRELLDLRARAYAKHHVLLQPADMAQLYAVREQISPNDYQMRILFHSCLAGQGPAWFWLRDAQRVTVASLLRDALNLPNPSLRQSAIPNLARVEGREAIPDLREMLKDEEEDVRRTAVSALAKVAGREAIPDLREMLNDKDGSVRQQAERVLIQVLPQVGWEAIPDLREMLKDEEEGVRQQAERVLIYVLQQVEREAIPDLREMLKDESGNVRRAAVSALAKMAGREAIPDLREMLKDEEEGVRRTTVSDMGKVAGREAIPDLREMLKDEEEGVRRTAVSALAKVAGQEAIPDLQEMLKDEDEYMQRAAVSAFFEVARREAIPNLREMLKDEDEHVRRAAVRALAETAGREAIPDLQEMLKDEDGDVRREAKEALIRVFQQVGREATPDLREMLKDEDEHVRRAAVRALAETAGREAIPDLREMLKDEEGDMRREAVSALAKVAGREAIPDLWEMLNDKDGIVRQQAEVVLIRVLQQVEQEAIPDLQGMPKDEEGEVRRAALRTLAEAAGREAIPGLQEMLRDEDEDVRWAAKKALIRVLQQVGQEAIPDLQEMLNDKDGIVRWAAVSALTRVAGREAIPDLRKMLNDKDRIVQQQAQTMLIRVSQPVGREAIPGLREMLKDEDEFVRRQAEMMLIPVLQQVGREAIPDLREMLKDESEEVRRVAAKALEELVTEDDRKWLVELTVDHSFAARGETANDLLMSLDRLLYFPT